MSDLPEITFVGAPPAPETYKVLAPRDLGRFWGKIEKRGPPECWPWGGAVFAGGYPAFWLRGQNARGHRVMCAMHHGLARGRIALHSCDTPACVNPHHLRWGTCADNMDDRSERDRAPRGSRHSQSKLTEAQVSEMRRLYGTGIGTPTLGRRFGVSQRTAWVIVTNKGWKR